MISETCNINENSCGCSTKAASSELDLISHWNRAYKTNEQDKLGWFEKIPEPSLRLLDNCALNSASTILNVGAGTANFVDFLLQKNFKNILVNDISPIALEKLKTVIADEDRNSVRYIVDDLTNPKELNHLEPINLWYDRAVLHFFQKQDEQDNYFDLLKKLVKVDGYVIIATFNLNGADNCSGLPVFRYDEKMLEKKLGNDFILTESFDYTYYMPSGDPREYVYTLFKRKTN